MRPRQPVTAPEQDEGDALLGAAMVAADADLDFKAIKARFHALNEARLARTRAAMTERQQTFLDVLPLLLHVNHPMLPGYASKDAPSGIPGYEPGKAAVDAAMRVARGFVSRKDPLRHTFAIQALYLMGSVGTIAYSDKSDLDIWVCHDPGLTAEQLQLLQTKVQGIERFTAELELEVHFFLINPEAFRAGEVGVLSDEGSGSAQHNLLLEEFYRTGLLIAGSPPIWWLVPPEQEANYDLYVAELTRKRFAHARGHIDFGGLAWVPAEEFLGAALWQLYKSIDSPYKSALKLILLESYAADYPHFDLLAMRFKRAVYAGEKSADRLDPYLMMLRKVEEYLGKRNDPVRLELARRCFYIKVDERLSVQKRKEVSWQREVIADLVNEWQWKRSELLQLDNRENWRVHRVTEEGRALFDALMTSYRFLSEFARYNAGLSLLSERDRTIIGRKLLAAYDRKPGKVEILNRGITPSLWESHLTFNEALSEDNRSSWQLYRGGVSPDNTGAVLPVKRSRGVVELAAWCYFNKVLDRSSAVLVHASKSHFSVNDLNGIVQRLTQVFPDELLEASTIQDFAAPARMLRAVLFVNAGVDLFTAQAIHKALASGRSDALSYGVLRENLVQELDLVLLTSWREVLVYHYTGARGLMECLLEYFKWAPPSRGEPPPNVYVHGQVTLRGKTVELRIEELFRDLITSFASTGGPTPRYLLAVQTGFVLVQFEGDLPRYRAIESYPALLRHLAAPLRAYVPTLLDRYALRDGPLPVIYSRNRPGWVQFFYRPNGSEVEIFVLDERGSLFYQKQDYYDASALVSQYSRFFEAVLNRVNFLMQEGQPVAAAEGLEFYLVRQEGSEWSLERRAPEFRMPGKHYFSLQVIIDAEEGGKPEFRLYVEEREFTTLEYGEELFPAVTRYVLELRQSGQHYPIYITDIGMSRTVLGEEGLGKIQTVHFLTYKRNIEEQLNRAMEELLHASGNPG